jgi:uncharacterized protein (DUF736 family)
MIIGNFIYDADFETYTGDITTLTLQRSGVVLRPNEKEGDRGPDYRIVQENDGETVEFGAAWKRRSDRGRAFLSVVLDDPALPASLNAALFLSDDGRRATLIWQRSNKKEPAAEPERSNARQPPASRNAGLTR